MYVGLGGVAGTHDLINRIGCEEPDEGVGAQEGGCTKQPLSMDDCCHKVGERLEAVGFRFKFGVEFICIKMPAKTTRLGLALPHPKYNNICKLTAFCCALPHDPLQHTTPFFFSRIDECQCMYDRW